MATEIGKAYVQIIPSAKGISSSIEKALGGEMSGAGEKAGGVFAGGLGKGIAGAGVALAGATAAATAAASAAIVGFGATAVNVGKDFDNAMAQVAATSGKTMDELNTEIITTKTSYGNFSGTLRDFANLMGRKTAFSATQAAEALNYMALAGYSAEDSVGMLPTVLNLAAAGNMELAAASDMVTDAQTALGLGAEETKTMVDQMAMASSRSNTSVAELGDAMLQIGATARNMSGGTQELSTILGILADNSIKGAEGGTHLRNILLAMNPTTDKAANAWEKLGVQAYDAQGHMRPLQDIMLDLGKAMQGMTDQEKQVTMSAMFNKTDLAAVNALIETQAERYESLGNAIGSAKSSAEQMANTQLDNLQGDITGFKSALEGAQITISDGLTPTLREFTQFGRESLLGMVDAFNAGGLDAAMAQLGTSLSNGLNMIVSKLPEVVNASTQLISALGQGLLDSAPLIINSAMEIVTILANSLLDALPSVAEGGIQMISQLASSIAQSAPTLIPEAVNAIIDTLITLLDNADQLVDGAVALILGLTDGIMNALPILIERLPEIIVKLVEALIINAPKVAMAGPQIMLALITGIISAIPQLLVLTPQIIGQLVETFVSEAPRMIASGREQIERMIQGITELVPKLLELPGQIINKLVTSFLRIGRGLIDVGRSIGEFFHEGISSIINDALSWGADLINNFIEGIKSGIDNLISVVSDAADAVADFLHFSEPEKGSLANFHTFAPDMMALFAQGIKDNTRLVTNQIKDSFNFADDIKSSMPDVSPMVINDPHNTNEKMVQNLTINAPKALDPSEIARQTKNANRAFVLQLRTT